MKEFIQRRQAEKNNRGILLHTKISDGIKTKEGQPETNPKKLAKIFDTYTKGVIKGTEVAARSSISQDNRQRNMEMKKIRKGTYAEKADYSMRMADTISSPGWRQMESGLKAMHAKNEQRKRRFPFSLRRH